MASASGTAERPTPLHSATPYPPIIAYPLSAGLLPEGRQYSTMVPTPTPPTSTEGTGYPFPTTIYSNNSSNSHNNYPPTPSARNQNHHLCSTHHLSAHPPQEQEQEQERSTDHDLPLPREPGARADHRADDLPSWTSVITPERKCTISDHAPLVGSFNGDQALAVGVHHPRPHSHSTSSEEAAWHHHRLAGSAPDLPRAPVAPEGLSSMPSLVDRPDLALPLGAMGMGMEVDSRSLPYGLMPQEQAQAQERQTRRETRMLTEMLMIDGGYRHASSDDYGNGAGGMNGYGGGGIDMYWHPTSSLPIKVESPPP